VSVTEIRTPDELEAEVLRVLRSVATPGDVPETELPIIAVSIVDAASATFTYAERQRAAGSIASHLESLARNYPEDIFPAGSESRDGISGTAMRHAYLNAARSVREDWPKLDAT
jgi:hypothetical protein